MLGNTTWRSDISYSDLDQTFMHVADSCIILILKSYILCLCYHRYCYYFYFINNKKIRTEKMIFDSS